MKSLIEENKRLKNDLFLLKERKKLTEENNKLKEEIKKYEQGIFLKIYNNILNKIKKLLESE